MDNDGKSTGEWSDYALPVRDVDVDDCGLDPLKAAVESMRKYSGISPTITFDGCRIPVGLFEEAKQLDGITLTRSCEVYTLWATNAEEADMPPTTDKDEFWCTWVDLSKVSKAQLGHPMNG